MLLLSGQRENYCFKNIKPLLIVYSSLSNLSPQVNIAHKKVVECHGLSPLNYLKIRGRYSLVNKIIISKHFKHF